MSNFTPGGLPSSCLVSQITGDSEHEILPSVSCSNNSIIAETSIAEAEETNEYFAHSKDHEENATFKSLPIKENERFVLCSLQLCNTNTEEYSMDIHEEKQGLY